MKQAGFTYVVSKLYILYISVTSYRVTLFFGIRRNYVKMYYICFQYSTVKSSLPIWTITKRI